MKPFSALRSAAIGACIAVAGLLFPLSATAQTAYEAPLPAELNTAPDLCTHVPCAEVLPGADSFSDRKGKPAYVEAYRNESGTNKLIGYVFLSTDIVDIPAYSGKPVITLIGMNTEGIITGTKILRHSEPILLLGIPETVLTKFVNQYLGKFVGDRIEIGKGRNEEGYIGLDAITGATVTVIAQNQVIMRSGVAIARQVGILKIEPKPPIRFSAMDERLGWDQMVKEGSVRRLTVKPEQLGMPRTPEPYVDMFFGYLNTPSVGKSVLGEGGYNSLMSRLKENEHAIFIISNGSDSFKGSGFVRGGIYDRLQVGQEMDAFTFRDLDYLPLWGVEAPGAPSFKESAIFIIRDPGFAAAYPWNLVFLGNKLDRETGHRDFVSFDNEYWVQAKYMEGGRPKVVKPDAPWVRVWKMRAVEIVLFSILLVGVGAVYAMRDRLTRMSTRKNKWPVDAFKYAAWIVSIFFIGFYLMAQPSITQVLTWFHALLFQWKWELFLTDPFIFLFWIFIIITVFLWGRGLFCGWLCPFGSLSELLYKIGSKLGLKRFQFMLPMKWHNRLKWVKYFVFFGLLAVSVLSMGLAEKLAEVEPFKTTFLVGIFNRSWPYTLFAAGLLGLSIFTERPFCKYLCPLGAALAMPSTFRWFGLKRKQECDSCKACAVGCGSLAIDDKGRIDHRECMLCLDCMVMYTDEHACPPLAQERKRRTKAGVALTPIGADGYYIPIKPVASATPKA
ncbi:4Fe-4S binding protein [Thauera sp.]|jgi:NosR/NirI family nitrous oxide reductase transcriptional regulator|uniref:4Fe-4S binding protein n=1 Tax=Thauera sp. TaxID=1905334 RepID=UPI002A359249|nr:4Fe-4S binding protein [Thauera sp.]MDX9884049.1 4Fe-4S binding protein [Thauera sp.]